MGNNENIRGKNLSTDKAVELEQASARLEGDESDGRRARSERSREKIIEAALKLVQSGDIRPGAQRVAETAKVSLRTVYRHFEDMESLYKEFASACDAKIMPIFMQPYKSAGWKGQLKEHLDRRLHVYEETMYLRMSTNARRFQSEFLEQDHKRHIKNERLGIQSLLPGELQNNSALVAALDVIMSFETYHRLRQENGHSTSKAKAVLVQMVDNTIRHLPD